MSGRNPSQIWDETVDEGQRRLGRGWLGLVSTGIFGGVDVMLGLIALLIVSGAVGSVAPEEVAHVAGSLVFGVGLATLVVGRSELFTENFLVPVGTVLHHRATKLALVRLWTVTMGANVLGILVLSVVFTRPGMLPGDALAAAGLLADTFVERDWGIAFLSAIVAGVVMTLFSWLTHAVRSDGARIALAMVIGFLLASPMLNHAVVSFGEISMGLLAGTSANTEWSHLFMNFPVAVAGNLVGGLGFVTLARLIQVRGEPEHVGKDYTGHEQIQREADLSR